MIVAATALSYAQSKEQGVSALIERTKQVSDIRAENAPAFRLKAGFRVTHYDGTSMEAVYTETWVSPRLWRSEVISGDLHQTKIVKDRTLWFSSNFPSATDLTPIDINVPERLVAFHLDGESLPFELWKSATIEDRNDVSRPLRCVKSKGLLGVLCFDKTTGILVAKKYLDERPTTGQKFESSCVYADYQKFGEKIFPRSVECVADGKQTLKGTVVELTATGAAPDPALFVQAGGATELPHCPGAVKPPEVSKQEDPSYPSFPSNLQVPDRPTMLLLTVGVDGIPQDVRVIRSGGNAFDKSSLAAAKKWRFWPATCSGEPIASKIQLEIEFHIH